MAIPDQFFPIIDRILLLSWLLKDFGWMTTNVFLGFPFGSISILLHLFVLLFDTRKSYLFYNISLLLWVTGNFIWMTLEFTVEHPSSNVHFGPHTPLGGVNESIVHDLIIMKISLFAIGVFVQLLLYLLILLKIVPIPEEDDEDIVSRNELALLCNNKQLKYSKTTDIDSIIDLGDELSNPTNSITLAFVENAYIIFWISKDLFWSWGTGDIAKGRDLAIFYESAAMGFGTISICIYIITSYLYRRNITRFIDCITTILWISANYVWMTGEFFLRYQNLDFDDATQGNDSETRVISSCLFCVGISLQLIILCNIWYRYKKLQQHLHHENKNETNPKRKEIKFIEMFSTKNPLPKYQNLVLNAQGNKYNQQIQSIESEDEENTVLF